MSALFDLSGRKALVTGGGRGLGRALAVGLAEHGADLRTPFEADEDWLVRCVNACDGRTPAEVAAICGCWSVLDFLIEHGVPRPAAEGADGLIAAALAGDRRTAEQLAGHADAARAQRPGLIVWAASRRAWPAIPLLAAQRAGGAGSAR